jgi:uncharacterized protein (DUF3084 family)
MEVVQLKKEKGVLRLERDNARVERDAAAKERDALLEERDNAVLKLAEVQSELERHTSSTALAEQKVGVRGPEIPDFRCSTSQRGDER